MTDPRLELAQYLGEPIAPPQDTDPPLTKVDGDKVLVEGQSDPLESLSLADLQKHPKLGAELKSWADTEAAKQLRGKTQTLRSQLASEVRAEVEQQVRDEVASQYFSGMSQEELGEALASDKDLAVEYSRLQARPPEVKPPTDISHAAMVYGYAAQIKSVHTYLEASDLESDKKAELQPEKYIDPAKGMSSLEDWTQAVYKAVIESEVRKQVAEALTEKWEAYRQERLVEGDLGLPRGSANLNNGRRASPLPDLMESSSSDLLYQALNRSKS